MIQQALHASVGFCFYVISAIKGCAKECPD